MTVHAPFLKNLLEYASFLDMDTDALKNLTSNPHIDFSDPEENLNTQDYLVVFKSITESSSSDSMGLNIGTYFNLKSLGLVLEISLSTSSIKQGIYILENFLGSKFPLVSIALVEDPGNYVLELNSSIENKALKRQILDMVLCIVYRELKLMLPNKVAPKITLPFSHKEQVHLFFTCDILNRSRHQILLPKKLDELEINLNRVKEIELLLPKFVLMVDENDRNKNHFSKNVRGITLNMCNPEIPNFNQVQKQFAYSKRTIQRRLREEGTTFRRIVNEIKRELSYHLSNEKHLKTKDIAYILGYSEPSAYLHALREWKKELKSKSTGANTV